MARLRGWGQRVPAHHPLRAIRKLVDKALVVFEAKPGAGGQAGIEFALSAPSDGYTLISTPSGAVSIVPNLRSVQFDPGKDLEPVAMLARVPVAIAVNGSLPVKSIAELIEYTKKQADGINYSVATVGTHMHLAAEIFKAQTGAKMLAVPYKGTGPAAAAVYSGEVQATVSDWLRCCRSPKKEEFVSLLLWIVSVRKLRLNCLRSLN